MEERNNVNESSAPQRRPAPTLNLDFKEILEIVTRKWYWFIISLVVCLGFAAVFIMRTAPQYKAATTIILLNEESDKSNVDLSSLGIGKRAGNVTNELHTLESPALMAEVVSRLGLNNRYYVKDGLRLVDLYKQTPISVTPADTLSTPYFSFRIKLDGNKNFELHDFSGCNPDGSTDTETRIAGALGQTVNTPIGPFTIAVSPWYNGNEYINDDILFVHRPVDDAAQSFSSGVGAWLTEDNSSVVTVDIVDVSRDRAIDILEALIEVYNDRLTTDQTRAAISTAEFINNRLAILEKDLGNVEGEISSFKSSNLMPDVASASSLYFGESFQTRGDLLQLNSEISMAQYVRRELLDDAIDQILPVNTGLAATGIQSQITEYNNLVLERNRLLTSGTADNPVIVELTQTIKTLKANMLRSLDNYITTLNMQLANLQNTQSHANSELSANPDREKYLLSVERQQKVKESLYMFLLQKREESELSQAYIKDNLKVLKPAQCPTTPIAPRSINILLVAVAIGLIAPLVILLLRESLISTVRTRRDLGMMTIPFVGEIPYGPGRHPRLNLLRRMHPAGPADVVVKPGSNNIINEAFRAVRTSIEFMLPDHAKDKARSLAFTSACAGSGKTYIVMNLATALSLSGKRVLVIDLDMRKAALSKWGPRTSRGISSFLIGQAEPSEIILNDVGGQNGLDLMPVGIMPPNPVELLSSPRLGELLESLADQYDYILIDCPPAELVADARLISAVVDMTVFIIRAGLFEKAMLADLNDFAEKGRYHNLSVILNGTDPNSLYRRKRYGYGYGYSTK